jgi:hypothetical protein
MFKKLSLIVILSLLVGCASQKPPQPNVVPTPALSVQINAFEPPPASDKNFQTYVVPHIQGVVIVVPWSSVEPVKGTYQFTDLDKKIASYTKLGLKVDLILELVSESVIKTGMNTATPAYVILVNHVGLTKCGLPLVWQDGFALPAHAFAAAVLSHYSAATVNIVRAGYVEGGENTLMCLPNSPKWNEKTFLAYVKAWDSFLAANNNGIKVVTNASDKLAKQEVTLAHAAGIGMGNSSLKESLIPWEKSLFGKYGSDLLYFQTDAAEGTATFKTLIPAVNAFHKGSVMFEVYYPDLKAEYVP